MLSGPDAPGLVLMLSLNNTRLTATPRATLNPNSFYRLAIRPELTDAAGISLRRDSDAYVALRLALALRPSDLLGDLLHSILAAGRQCERTKMANPLFSPRGEAKCVRGASVRGARCLTSGGVLDSTSEHGEQAQRSNGAPIACFDRQAVRNPG